MRGLSFLADGELFTVDVTLVQKVVRRMSITPVPSAPEAVAGIANMKGRVVTVINLTQLLGHKKKKRRGSSADDVNAIVFKTKFDNDDQMGLIIDKPGNLIDIEDSAIRSPPLTTGMDESICISGIAEVDNNFYRIIDLNSISQRYMDSGEISTGNSSYGGNDNG